MDTEKAFYVVCIKNPFSWFGLILIRNNPGWGFEFEATRSFRKAAPKTATHVNVIIKIMWLTSKFK